MQVLRDAGDLAKGDQKGRKGGIKGEFESHPNLLYNEQSCMPVELLSQLFCKMQKYI